jgi:hypothetical protein
MLIILTDMNDREHEEWLENRNARKAAAKKHKKPLPARPPKDEEKKRDEPQDDLGDHVWRGEY